MIKLAVNTFFTKIISAVCNLLVAILISKILGAEAKGETSILLTNVSLVLLFINIFGGSTVAFLLSKYHYKIIVEWFFGASVLISFVSFFVFYFFSKALLFSLHCSVLSFLLSQFSFFQNIFIRLNKIKQLNFLLTLQSTLFLFIVFLGLVIANKGQEIYTIGLYVSYFVSLTYSVFFFYKNKQELANQNKKIDFSILVKVGIQNQLSHIFYAFVMRFSYYLLLWKQGKFSVGVFSNAIIIAEGIWLISSSLATIQYAKIINSTLSDSIKITLSFCRIGFIACFALLLFLMFLPLHFFTFIFGNDFYEVKSIVMYLAPGIVLYNFAIIIGHFFSGIGHFKINTLSNFVGLLTASISLLFFHKNFSIAHAILFHNIAYLTISTLLVYFFIKKNKLTIRTIFCISNDLNYIKDFFQKR